MDNTAPERKRLVLPNHHIPLCPLHVQCQSSDSPPALSPLALPLQRVSQTGVHTLEIEDKLLVGILRYVGAVVAEPETLKGA